MRRNQHIDIIRLMLMALLLCFLSFPVLVHAEEIEKKRDLDVTDLDSYEEIEEYDASSSIIDSLPNGGIKDRITNIYSTWSDGKHFTTDGKACNDASSNCKKCRLSNIAPDVYRAIGSDANSCASFAAYCFYKIFGLSYFDNSNTVRTVVYSLDELNRTAKVGDHIACCKGNDKNQLHYGIYLKSEGGLLYLYESNFSVCNQINASKGVSPTSKGWNCFVIRHPKDSIYNNVNGISGEAPIGTVDAIEGGIGTVHVRGWAFDSDNKSVSLDIHVYIGGPSGVGEGHIITADKRREDVNDVYLCGSNHGFDEVIETGKKGTQPIYVYAIDVGNTHLGNPLLDNSPKSVYIDSDTSAPTISDIKVENVTSSGYDISCIANDNVGVTTVRFPTWTEKDGQDDLIWHEGSYSNGRWKYHVNVSDHKDEGGLYITHIYARDAAGNEKSDGTSVYIDKVGPDISNVKLKNATKLGFDLICTAKDDVEVVKVIFNVGNKSFSGKNSGDHWECHVNSSEIDKGPQMLNINAYDSSGNDRFTGKRIYSGRTREDLSFETNGGSQINYVVKYGMIVSYDDIKEGTKSITKDGFSFAGWFTDSSLTSECPSYIYYDNEAMKLYAKWKTGSIKVSDISLSDIKVNLNIGSTKQLDAEIKPANATNKKVSWKSNKEIVATVSNTGLITAVSKGTATITVITEDGNKTASCEVTVTDKRISVTGVSLSDEKISMSEKSTQKLTAMITPADASNKNVSWKSSNESVVKVDNAGVLTSISKGTATITVTTEDGNKTASCSVTVVDESTVVHVTSVSIYEAKTTLKVGESNQFTIMILPMDATNRNRTWESSDPSVATVENGLVTAKSVGTTRITVTMEDGGKTSFRDVTVEEGKVTPTPTPTPTIRPDKTIFAGGKTSIKLKKKVGRVTTSDYYVASVQKKGKKVIIKGRNEGTTTVEAYDKKGNKLGSWVVEVFEW